MLNHISVSNTCVLVCKVGMMCLRYVFKPRHHVDFCWLEQQFPIVVVSPLFVVYCPADETLFGNHNNKIIISIYYFQIEKCRKKNRSFNRSNFKTFYLRVNCVSPQLMPLSNFVNLLLSFHSPIFPIVFSFQQLHFQSPTLHSSNCH